MAIIPAGTNWKPSGTLHTFSEWLRCKDAPTEPPQSHSQSQKRHKDDDPRLIQYESMTPIATMIWAIPVILPRTSFGAHSETKVGATAEIPPIPSPAMTRPEYM